MHIQYNRFRNIASTNSSQYIYLSIKDSILDNLLITSILESLEFFNFSKNENCYISIVDFHIWDSNMGLKCSCRDVVKFYISRVNWILARIKSF